MSTVSAVSTVPTVLTDYSKVLPPSLMVFFCRNLRGPRAVQTVRQYNMIMEYRGLLGREELARDSRSRSVSRWDCWTWISSMSESVIKFSADLGEKKLWEFKSRPRTNSGDARGPKCQICIETQHYISNVELQSQYCSRMAFIELQELVIWLHTKYSNLTYFSQEKVSK